MQIVAATAEHLAEIARIYEAEVAGSATTFDLEPPSPEAWGDALARVDPSRGHFLIVALDNRETVLGYAKSGRFRERAAYDTTCETSIYIAADARGRGVGRALYARLIELLEASEARVAVGVMTEPNPASATLHESLGFTSAGTLEGVGMKFGRAWDVTLYQRPV